MSTEIELKYLVIGDNIADKITDCLTEQNLSFEQETHELKNSYFDTTDFNLRQHDIGLRVRTHNKGMEQTIKTSGKVIGGLHQRPEYNVEITKPSPDLSLFPSLIWQKDQDIKKLQAQLTCIFTTHFKRLTWTITDDQGGVIELAFDQGTISVDELSDPICEIELELISGEQTRLFELAQCLFKALLLRSGYKSKAARGYALVNKQPQQVLLTPLELVPLNKQSTINNAFIVGVEFGLSQLQIMVDQYASTPSLSLLAKINELLALIRHGFWQFDEFLPEEFQQIRSEITYFIQLFNWVDNAIHIQELNDKTGNYCNKLAYSEALEKKLKRAESKLPTSNEVTELLHSFRFNELQLSLLKLLLIEPQQGELFKNKGLNLFAKTKLEDSFNELNAGISSYTTSSSMMLTSDNYLSLNTSLIHSLLSGSWFGGLYSKIERIEYRAPWLDIKQGISELQTLCILRQQLEMLDEPTIKLENWLNDKVESLLQAMEQSRAKALSLTPYWRK